MLPHDPRDVHSLDVTLPVESQNAHIKLMCKAVIEVSISHPGETRHC